MKHAIEPQEWAIDLSIKNGNRDFGNYDVELFTRQAYVVSHREDISRLYFVDLSDATCDCPFCEANGVCKHLWIVGEHLRIEEAEQEIEFAWEAEPDEYAHPESRRYQ